MSAPPLSLILEFSRQSDHDQPFIVPGDAQGYQLRERGGGVRSATLPWADLEADLTALDRPDGYAAVGQRLGDGLRAFLVEAGWEKHERALIAAVDTGQPVRVTIRSTAAELYALPWELTALGGRRQHWHELPDVLVRYEWPETHTAPERPPPRHEGGRILLAWSAALGGVPATRHVDAIQAACAAGGHRFDSERDVRAHASLNGLRLALADKEREPVAVLHLLCHGARHGDGFALGLNAGGAGSAAALVDSARLRQVLAPHAGHVRLVVLSVCDGGNPGGFGSHVGSVAQALHCAGIQAVIASRVPLAKSDSVALCRGFYWPLLCQPASVEMALRAARAELAEDAASAAWASWQLYARDADGWDTRPLVIRPYRGLLPFTAEHARFFRGRQAERRAVRDKLLALRAAGAPRVVVVAGASGRGKSSLVRGGVAPALAREGWQVGEMRPGAQPERALDELLAGRLSAALGDGEAVSDPGAERIPGPGSLLVIDQFDELFTYTEDPADRLAFMQRVWSLCARPDSRLHCVLTVRVDFLDDCGQLAIDDSGRTLERVVYDGAHVVFLASMARDELRTSISEPAAMVGVQLQDGLAERILDDVAGEPGPLPLVQYTLDLLWHRRVGSALAMAAYDQLGGVSGALQLRANELIDALSGEQQKQARRLLVRLVSLRESSSRDTHRRMTRVQLAPGDDTERAAFDIVVDALVDARLVVRSDLDGQPALEVAHEALIRKWPRLRGWLDEDRKKLAEIQKLERWEKQWREFGTLLDGAQLGYAVQVRETYSEELGAGTLALVCASEVEAKARVRIARKRRAIVGTVSVLLLVALIVGILGVFAHQQARRAERETARASQQARRAERERTRANQALATAATLALNVSLRIERGLADYPGLAELRKPLLVDAQKLLQTLLAASPGHAGLLRSKMVVHKRLGHLAMSYDALAVARAQYQAALDIARRLVDTPTGQRDLSVALVAMADVAVAEGNLALAGSFLQQSLELRETLAAQDPDNVAAYRDITVSLNKLGNIARAQGDLALARSFFQQSLDFRKSLAARDPDNAGARRDLSVSLGKLGDVARAQGDLALARSFFLQSRNIDQALVARDPGNVVARRDLAVSLDKLGDVAKAQGDLALAHSFFLQSLDVRQTLANQDPGNVAVRRDLSLSLDKLGDVAKAQSDLILARSLFQKSLDIRESLSTQDPDNARARRDLSVSLNKLGNIAKAQDDLARAHSFFLRSFHLRKTLAAQDPDNARARRDLSVSLYKLGDVALTQGNPAQARGFFQKSLDIDQALAGQDPDNARARRDLSVSLSKLGEVALAQGDLSQARGFFQKSLDIDQALADQDPDNADWLIDLARSYKKLSIVAAQASDTRAFCAHVNSGQQIVDRLSQNSTLQTSADLADIREFYSEASKQSCK